MIESRNVHLETPEALQAARDRGVELWTEGSRLRFRSPGGRLPEDVRLRLADSKDEVVAALQKEAAGTVTHHPMAENQLGIWHSQRMAPSSTAYNLGIAYSIPPELDPRHLAEAVQVLVDRHEVLRTDYPEVDGAPVRRVVGFCATRPVEAVVEGGETLDAALARLVAEPFALDEGPLFRTWRVRDGTRDVVLLLAHHLTLDGLSIHLLAREVFTLYGAIAKGSPLPEAAASPELYSEWVESQRIWLERNGEEAAAYWSGVLDPPPPTLALPLDGTGEGGEPMPATRTRLLSAEVSGLVRDVCRSNGCSPFVGMLAAYGAFLQRLTGESDVVVGTPVHGRSAARFAATLGHLVNVIPVRIRNSDDGSFLDLMEEVRQAFAESSPFQDYPLPRVTWSFAAEHGTAPVRTMFAVHDFRQFSELRAREADTSLREVPFDQLEGQFDVNVEIYYEDGRYRCAWRHDESVLAGGTVAAWAEVFARFVEDLMRAPDEPVVQVALRHAEDVGVLRGPAVQHYTRPVHLAIVDQATRTPDRTAVEAPDGSYTYRQVVDRARAFRAALRERGVGPGDRVGVLLQRTRDLIPALMGVHGSGAAYVPLDPAHPESRLQTMVDDAAIAALVTHRDLDRLLSSLPPTVAVEELDSTAGSDLLDVDLESAAYAIYTSGSTGAPKAVVVPHRAVANFLGSMAEAPGFDASDTLLAVTTVAFDISVLELFLPLTVGGRVVLASAAEASDGRALARHLVDGGITVMQGTPATWKLLLMADWAGKSDLRALCGGEALPVGLAEELKPRVRELWNLYGPTETTVWSTIHRVENTRPILIGSPIANTTAWVVDRVGHPLPSGFTGELLLGGAGVATGYLGRPELTADRFVASDLEPGAILYRTGDRVRQRTGGSLEHLGRLDDQVKVRGFRIEPGEVEEVLRRHESVRDAVCAVIDDHLGDATLGAWLVAEGEREVDMRRLRKHVAAHLPAYMVPTAWASLEEIPLSASGKVDRRALLHSLDSAQALSVPSEIGRAGPRNAEEEVLVDIWRHVLRRDRVGVYDDFFALGGHSLLATMITSRVRSVFGVELPLRRLFAEPTIAAVAEWIRSASGTTPTLPPIRPVDPDEPAPLSFSQERMWFLQQLNPDDVSYNLSMATIVDGLFDRERLLQAVQALEERHAILRSRIVSLQGRPHQVTVPAGSFSIRSHDLRHLGVDEAEKAARRMATEELYRPYDLEHDPPLRLVVVRVGEDRELLALGMHHVVADQGSFEIMIAELSEIYQRGADDARLAPLDVSYADFAVWQREQLAGDALASSLSFWREKLRDVPPLELPTDRPRPPRIRHEGQRVSRVMSLETVEALGRFSVEAQATPFMLLLAAYAVFLHARTRQVDIPVGIPTAHRSHPDLEGLVGTFVNTLVHRNDLSGNPTFRDIVDRIRETALDAFTHQDVPFALLVRELNPPRDESRPPLFQVLFNVANLRIGEGGLPGLATEALQLPYPGAQFDITVTAEMNERRNVYHLSYRSDLFDAETAEAMIEQYGEIVERSLRDPDLSLADLACAPRDERWLLLDEWNRTEVETPPFDVIAEVTRHAERTPERVAVETSSGSWTYRELCEAARATTAGLRELGVVEGDLVGVSLPRGRELVAALIGIWGAGAAYVPMDPDYPTTRLNFMLDDSGAVALVSRGDAGETFQRTLPTLDPCSPPGRTTDSPNDDIEVVAAAGERRAYVIYTSGSTGQPKGVELPHRAVGNFLASMARAPGLGADDGLLAVTTVSFDISVLELFLPLCVGARVVLAGDEEAKDGTWLADRLSRGDITVMQATPSTWKLLIAAGWDGTDGLKVLCGGEALAPQLAEALRPRCDQLWNMYGPTETTVWSTVERIESEGPVSIGRPIANTTAYVLDEGLVPVPIGVPGELFIGGRGVALGYLGRSELTAERFLDDPFRPEERVYRTGDQVRYFRDGRLEHLGRLDHQVKVRGHRIELPEIESALRAHPGVLDCVCVARDDRLLAFVRYEAGSAATNRDLRDWTSKRLPMYMVPSLFIPLDSFPLTPNGKVDRARLPHQLRPPRTERTEPLSGKAETRIAAVWRDLLGVDEVGPHDNFFELGGHSLLAMEAVELMNQKVGFRLAPRELFFKNLRQLAAAGMRGSE